MTIASARTWLIWVSLIGSGASLVFFIVAPPIGYPLTPDQARRLLQIIIPVFAAYLGSATRFIFSSSKQSTAISIAGTPTQLGLIVRGPVIVWGVVTLAAIVVFGFSNRASSTPGSGMDIDALAWILTTTLGLFTVTTNAVVAHVFVAKAT